MSAAYMTRACMRFLPCSGRSRLSAPGATCSAQQCHRSAASTGNTTFGLCAVPGRRAARPPPPGARA